ncbi:hypothetical protein RCL1_007283 [Eukaryota sp. TZLM3-RCL]
MFLSLFILLNCLVVLAVCQDHLHLLGSFGTLNEDPISLSILPSDAHSIYHVKHDDTKYTSIAVFKLGNQPRLHIFTNHFSSSFFDSETSPETLTLVKPFESVPVKSASLVYSNEKRIIYVVDEITSEVLKLEEGDLSYSKIDSLSGISEVKSGKSHTLFLTSNGKVFSIGHDNNCKGTGFTSNCNNPKEVLISNQISKIFTFNEISFAIDSNNQLFVFGQGHTGTLVTNPTSPIQIQGPLSNHEIKKVGFFEDVLYVSTHSGAVFSTSKDDFSLFTLLKRTYSSQNSPLTFHQMDLDLSGNSAIDIEINSLGGVVLLSNGKVLIIKKDGIFEDQGPFKSVQSTPFSFFFKPGTPSFTPKHPISFRRFRSWSSSSISESNLGRIAKSFASSTIHPSIIPLPIDSPLNVEFIKIVANSDASFAITSDYYLYSWGISDHGFLLKNEPTTRELIMKSSYSSKVKDITISATNNPLFAILISESNTLHSWGVAGTDPVYIARSFNRITPTLITSLQDHQFTSITSSSSVVLALDSDGLVYSWGKGYLGRQGNNGWGTEQSPESDGVPRIIELQSNSPVIHVSCGFEVCGLLTLKGELFTFGKSNLIGRKVSGSISAFQPTKLDLLVKSFSFAGEVCLLINHEDVVYSWGSQSNLIGRGGSSDLPGRIIVSDQEFSDVVSTGFGGLLVNRFSLFSFGNEFGSGTGLDRNSPQRIPDISGSIKYAFSTGSRSFILPGAYQSINPIAEPATSDLYFYLLIAFALTLISLLGVAFYKGWIPIPKFVSKFFHLISRIFVSDKMIKGVCEYDDGETLILLSNVEVKLCKKVTTENKGFVEMHTIDHVITSRDGSFEFRGVSSGHYFIKTFLYPFKPTQSQSILATSERRAQPIKVKMSLSVRDLVIAINDVKTSLPIPNADVILTRDFDLPRGIVSDLPQAIKSNDKGIVKIPSFILGNYSFSLSHSNYTGKVGKIDLIDGIDWSETHPKSVVFALEPAFFDISFKVFNVSTLLPAPSAIASLYTMTSSGEEKLIQSAEYSSISQSKMIVFDSKVAAGSLLLKISSPGFFDHVAPILIPNDTELMDRILLEPMFVKSFVFNCEKCNTTVNPSEITVSINNQPVNFDINREGHATLSFYRGLIPIIFSHPYYNDFEFSLDTINSSNLILVPLKVKSNLLISGIVENKDGRPISGVNVSIVDQSKTVAVGQVISDKSGKFDVTGLCPGNFELKTCHELYHNHQSTVKNPQSNLIVSLEKKSFNYSGTIFDSNTKEIVRNTSIKMIGFSSGEEVKNQAQNDGSFDFNNLLIDEKYSITIESPLYSIYEIKKKQFNQNLIDQSLFLTPLSTKVNGSVISSSSKVPLYDVTLTLLDQSNQEIAKISAQKDSKTGNSIFSFSNLTSGKYTITATHSNYSNQNLEVFFNHFNIRKELDLIIELEPLLFNPEIEVVDEQTLQPIPNFDVNISDLNISITGINGKFSPTQIPTGNYNFIVSSIGYKNFNSIVSVPIPKDFKIKLKSNVLKIKGNIKSCKAQLNQTTLKLIGPEFSTEISIKNDWSFDFNQSRLLHGQYSLQLSSPGHQSISSSIIFDETSHNFSLDFDLCPVYLTLSLGGVVDVETREPLEDAEVKIGDFTATTNQDGIFELPSNLIVGDYNVTVNCPDYNQFQSIIPLSLDTSELIIELNQPKFDFIFSVRDEHSAVVIPNVTCTLTRNQKYISNIQTDSEGNGSFKQPRGNYFLSLEAPDYSSKIDLEISVTPKSKRHRAVFSLTRQSRFNILLQFYSQERTPVTGVSVSVAGINSDEPFTSSSHIVVIPSLLPGSYSVVVKHQLYKEEFKSLLLNDSQLEETILLTLKPKIVSQVDESDLETLRNLEQLFVHLRQNSNSSSQFFKILEKTFPSMRSASSIQNHLLSPLAAYISSIFTTSNDLVHRLPSKNNVFGMLASNLSFVGNCRDLLGITVTHVLDICLKITDTILNHLHENHIEAEISDAIVDMVTLVGKVDAFLINLKTKKVVTTHNLEIEDMNRKLAIASGKIFARINGSLMKHGL